MRSRQDLEIVVEGCGEREDALDLRICERMSWSRAEIVICKHRRLGCVMLVVFC